MDYNQELLFTPEGVRDIYGDECARRLVVQENLHQIMRLYGFQDIKTPTFEFFDIFSRQRGSVASREMYKFFDRNNNTLVLRPDITPSIARSVAKYYKEEDMQVRLCYVGNTFVNSSSYQGKLKEVCQIGAELINDCSSDADGEMIALTIECLQRAGLTEFQVDIGHADFFLGLVEEAGLKDSEVDELKALLENKNMFGVEDFLENKKIDENLKELFVKLPELFGDEESFSYVRSKTKNERVLNAVARLETLNSILETYGLSDYATFDFSMLSHYNYYTGVIFKAYTYGTGEPVATGGRYDHLVEQFGKRASAIGVAIVLDQLMLALARQKIETKVEEDIVLVLYHSQNRKTAICIGNHYRENGISTRLMRKESGHGMENYVAYGRKNRVKEILYIENEESIHVHSIEHDTETVMTCKELCER
ncbi:MAG: ATP phosphoribosyltransferase regulatory subunit [Lachnospiraceae bacterium]|nr:ATP phosphoribosyltransferase regulatory subunit [Lachnospiraceae bacterium]